MNKTDKDHDLKFLAPDIDAQQVLDLCVRWPFHPWRSYVALSPRQRAAFLIDDLGRIHSGEQFETFYFKSSDTIDAFCALKKCRWDSQYFGIPMGKISHYLFLPGTKENSQRRREQIDSVLNRAVRQKIEHLTVRVDSADVATQRLFADCGFRIITAEFVYIIDTIPSLARSQGNSEISVRAFRPGDVDEIVAIAEEIDRELPSRFALDTTLPCTQSVHYYAECVKNACGKQNADEMFIGIHHGRIVGFYALRCIKGNRQHECPDVYHSVILGIDPLRRQKGIATSFFNHVFQRLLAQRCFFTGRVYAHNVPMFFLMNKFNAQQVSIQYCMHKTTGK